MEHRAPQFGYDNETVLTQTVFKNKQIMTELNNEIERFEFSKLKQINQSKTFTLIDQIKQFDKSTLKHVDIADDNVSECVKNVVIPR